METDQAIIEAVRSANNARVVCISPSRACGKVAAMALFADDVRRLSTRMLEVPTEMQVAKGKPTSSEVLMRMVERVNNRRGKLW